MLTPDEAEAYLGRLGLAPGPTPDAAFLERLHVAHLRRVPFENLDIALGRAFDLERSGLFDKLVRRRRGGFCYELNGLFAELLEALGFAVARLSGRVWDGAAWGPRHDHLMLEVQADGPRLVDVGFGDSFERPLPLAHGAERELHGDLHRLERDGAGWILSRRRGDETEPQVRFDRAVHALEDFTAMCHWQRTAPESAFTRKAICTLATAVGRVTFRDGQLHHVEHGVRRAGPVLGDVATCRAVLRREFGLELPEDAPLERLLAAPG